MKRLLFFILIVVTTLSTAGAQTTRKLQTESNGFKWYNTFSSDSRYQGAESTDGRTIVLLSKGYDMIVFHEKKDCIGYFSVYKNGKKGAYDIHGNLVIEPIHEKLYYLSKKGFYYEDAYGNDHYLGITLDANGRASSASGSSSYTPSSSSSYGTQQGNKELQTESNGFKWYNTFSSDSRYQGAESTDGRTIIPLSKQYTQVVFHEKKDCIGYFSVHKNGKKGAYDIHGNLVIEPIHEKIYYLSKGFSYEDAYGTDHYLDITLDANGRASSASGTSTASTAYSSTSSSSSTSPRTFDFYFLYLYDVMSEKNKLPNDCDKSPSPNSDLCTELNNFVMRYELYDTYFKVSIIATNLGTKKEDVVEQHRIYPKEAEMLTANGGYTIVWGNTNNLTIRENKSMLTLLDGDVKKQKVLSCDTTKNVNRILRTAYKAVDCTTVKLEDQYSAKYSQLVSYLRRYSWKATGAAD